MNATLTRFERRWAHAAFDTIFPGAERGSLPLGIEDMGLDAFLDETLTSLPFESSIGLRLSVWVIALAPLFVLRRFVTIASLAAEERERVVGAIAASSFYAVRSTVLALKAIGALLYCGDLRVRPLMMGTVAPKSAIVTLRTRSLPPASSLASPGATHEPQRHTA
ncbi:MAG TPA: hypothetical protein VGI39_14685 [Polyangiaceae bacterium]|jgi:hypothetical protein